MNSLSVYLLKRSSTSRLRLRSSEAKRRITAQRRLRRPYRTGYSRDENDVPVPLLHSRVPQLLKVDLLLLELAVVRRKLVFCGDGASVLADARVPFRGENLAQDVSAGGSCRSKDECAESYTQTTPSVTLQGEFVTTEGHT